MFTPNCEQVQVNVVGSSIFGRHPKISLERTINMFISDDWLVNYAGFKARLEITSIGKGRALFRSIHGGFSIAVSGSSVFKISTNLVPTFIGNLNTSQGEVIIAENLSQQICIVDGQSAWIYNYTLQTFTQQTLTFDGNPVIPGFVSYHNTFFLIASNTNSINAQNWYAYEVNPGDETQIQFNSQFSLQTKSDKALAVIPVPGRGNNVIVLGTVVGEIWTNIGGNENYRRISSYNIDFGTVSKFTLAADETLVAWISQNQNSSPALMISDGSETKRISTDGIDYLLETITRPDQSTAIFFRMDGHLFYQFTFYNPEDNLTLIYDFNTGKFFDLIDNNFNYHPARQLIYFNNKQYFVSLNDGNLYETGTNFITYSYSINDDSKDHIIPRIRIPKTIRRATGERFRANRFQFWLEQGVNKFYLANTLNGIFCNGLLITEDGADFIVSENGVNILGESGSCGANLERPCVDLSISKNGNESFSTNVRRFLNPQGIYKNIIHWDSFGQANEITLQLNFWGLQRFVANDGVLELVA